MTQSIPIQCLIDRSWNPSTRDWEGTLVSGTLIDISTQTADDHSGKQITVGVIILAEGIFQCVPIEFILAI